MTNEVMLSVLNNLCNEARDSAHATFGLMELHREATDPIWQACLEISRTSTDRLLRSMDDFRDLLSDAPVISDVVEEFDVVLSLGEAIELLNIASTEKTPRIRLDASAGPLIVRQDRPALEEVFTRILDAASKLTKTGDLQVVTNTGMDGDDARFAIAPSDSTIAVNLAEWLNADPEQVHFHDSDKITIGVAVMVAGRRLRALGGRAELVCQPGEASQVVIHLHSQPDGISCNDGPSRSPEAQADTLNILLTEDCEESYAFTKLLLRNENVWWARNGPEAIDIVKKQRFDVVFMDIHMPGMDGYAAIHAIRDWETQTGNARTPIVVLSSDDVETQRRSAARSGCSGFMRKPLRNADLLDLLGRLKATRSLVS